MNLLAKLRRTGEITARLSVENNVVISCILVDVDKYEVQQSPPPMNVRREGIPV